MTENVPFAEAADGVINNTQNAIDRLVDALDDKILDSRDELASWLKAYIPLARIAHNAEGEKLNIRGSQVYDLLKESAAYRPYYHYMDVADQRNVPAKAYLDTALSEIVRTLGNKKPVHPTALLGQIDEYQCKRKEEDALSFTDTVYFGHDYN